MSSDYTSCPIVAVARVEKSIEIEVTPDKIWEMFLWDRIPEWHIPPQRRTFLPIAK